MRPKFQQRHYEVIAEILRSEFAKCASENEVKIIRSMVRAFDYEFTLDNPNFNTDRFQVAAGARF